ncbi:MAG: SGNH/GDSL hydrolase family protein [Bacteroidetes bacterium]|uniref:SGNH/GDSL hydrolase family protein n=1 Tax=Candidatus Egerieousia excrementavium TaxID=2840778 RepID=A0A9D9DNN6_9BACT|nr:SGNH/GDSL hydrolase family protein [Candidatus Egerieousia excrementavium]
MKKIFTIAAILLAASLSDMYGQDWADLNRYREADKILASETPVNGRVVFMGNSITENWYKFHPEFFTENGFIARGISGQTTPQMLVRFRQDVVNIGAETVVILAGTNDIAGNTGYASLDMIMDNIKSMCEIAKSNGIKVVLCSVLPAYRYSWNREVEPNRLIPQLNFMIKEYAGKMGIEYIDFFSAMADNTPGNENGLPSRLSKDGVHPNLEGYRIMEELISGALL